MSETIVQLRGVHKVYTRGKNDVKVLNGVDLAIEKGAFEALMGPSGSGKSTLLNLIAGLDRPTSGEVIVAGESVGTLGEGALADFRARTIGFIFQAFNLIPVLTAAQNVELPLALTPLTSAQRKKNVETALSVVGLGDRMHHLPRQLSGGQEQRVAIARAIVTDPRIIVADEPTGDLDRESADEVMKLLVKLATEFDKTILMVTHDPIVAGMAHRVRRVDKGRLLVDAPTAAAAEA